MHSVTVTSEMTKTNVVVFVLSPDQRHIIIIINFSDAYILRNLSSEAQQNRISKHNRDQGRAKVSIKTRDNRTVMVEMQFGIDMP